MNGKRLLTLVLAVVPVLAALAVTAILLIIFGASPGRIIPGDVQRRIRRSGKNAQCGGFLDSLAAQFRLACW